MVFLISYYSPERRCNRIRRLLGKEEWEEFYDGDDGTHTFYIDMVERKFAASSTAEQEKRYALLDSVDEMFRRVNNDVNTRRN